MKHTAVSGFIVGLLALGRADIVPAAEPPSGLMIRYESNPESLVIPSGKTIGFSLRQMPVGRWAEVNVGAFIIRGPEKQEAVPTSIANEDGVIPFVFRKPGWYLVALSTGPAEMRGRSDSWQAVTHCTKLIVQATGETAGTLGPPPYRSSAGLTAKLGERFEIVPLIAPPSLRVGGDLPVRVFFDFDKLVGERVQAVRPDGSMDVRTTDAVGSVIFPITQPGRWIIRYEKPLEGWTRTAELVFDVAAPTEPKEEKP